MRKKHMSRRDKGRGWILPYVRRHGWRVFLAAAMGMLAVGCGGGLLFTSGYLISRAALQPEHILMIYVPIVLVRTFGFGKAVLQYVERLLSHDAVLRILSSMRARLYRALEPQAVYARSRFQTGDLLGMLAEDIEQLQNVYLRLALPSVTAVLVYGLSVAFLGRLDVDFALLMALYCGFLLFTLPMLALVLTRARRKRHLHHRHRLYQELTDSLFGMRDWIVSGRTHHWLTRFRASQSAMLSLEKRLRRTEWKVDWILHLAIGGAVVLMAIWASEMVRGGRFAPEWIAAYVFITFPLLESMVRAAQALMTAPHYRISLNRLQTVERSSSRDVPEGNTTAAGHRVAEPVRIRSAPGKKQAYIDLRGVSYRYEGAAEPSVNGVSLQIQKGEKVAVLGRSGAGKSTLLKLVLGELTPSEGDLTIDGMGAVQARECRYFSVMNQQPYLFNTSIANNIRLGRPNATDEEVRIAAEQAGLGDLLASLPDGMDTSVREAGIRFSGGERQRIALARILLQDRPIVLLDEPTVGLDPLTEYRLLETLFDSLKGKTVIWITHHLLGMENMDHIVFMEQGRITMQGNHEQLLKQYERYRQLYALDRPLEQEACFRRVGASP